MQVADFLAGCDSQVALFDRLDTGSVSQGTGDERALACLLVLTGSTLRFHKNALLVRCADSRSMVQVVLTPPIGTASSLQLANCLHMSERSEWVQLPLCFRFSNP